MGEEIGSFWEEERALEEVLPNVDIQNIITNLKLRSNNVAMLTDLYTEILMDDNVLYILTKVSQNVVFMEHFPEFYQKNLEGENVINCQQNSKYHRYGVFKHILYTIEHVGKNNPKLTANDLRLLKWTMLLHDIGKPSVKIINEDGSESFAGHDEASLEIASRILDRFDFEEYEKKIILTLIRYHDKYLNEGELTYDNLRFLAAELDDRADLFNLLIEVKVADNKAKTIDVYNKFMVVVKKYYDFANEYFSNMDYSDIEGEESIVSGIKIEENQGLNTTIIIDEEIEEKKEEKEQGFTIKVDTEKVTVKDVNDITDAEFENIYQTIVNGKACKYAFQPIISLRKKEVFGYEIKPILNIGEGLSLEKILKKSRDVKKYERVQQLLFIALLENYVKVKSGKLGFIKIDVPSYDTYVNKSRIYDMFDDAKIVMQFNNYLKYNTVELKEKIEEIRHKQGFVLLDNYQDNNLDITSLDVINPEYIKYDLPKGELDENVKKYVMEILTYSSSSGVRPIFNHIDDEEKYDFIKSCGADLVQGNYFAEPSDRADFDVKKLSNDKI